MQIELKRIQKSTGITFIYVTHDQEEALTMSDTVVVMNDGDIQQIGTPEDIYNEPKNAFVADFIGESNIIDGIMLRDCFVEFAGAQFDCVDKGFAPNEPVDVVVRPEDVKVVGEGQGQLSGMVESVTFKGVHFEIRPGVADPFVPEPGSRLGNRDSAGPGRHPYYEENGGIAMKTKYSSLFSLPYLIWSLIFIIVPMGLVVVFAFTTEGGQFTLDYVSQVGEYTNVLVRSVWLAAIATIICLLIGYPLAFIMSRMPGFQQRTMLMLIMLPMWMNFLLRTYAWMTILEKNGLLNKLFGLVGLGPFDMINTQGAVVLGMVYNYLPFMILPLYSIMTKIDNRTIEAAQDLGANTKNVFTRIVIPMSMPGISTGITMVFVPSVSTFIISRMLGGGGNLLIGDLIDLQFLGNAYNPHLGSAISLVLMVLILLCMSILNQFNSDEDREGMLL